MSRRPARCTEADIKRAIKAADASAEPRVVEITSSGTIRLVPAPKTQSVPADSAEDIVL